MVRKTNPLVMEGFLEINAARIRFVRFFLVGELNVKFDCRNCLLIVDFSGLI